MSYIVLELLQLNDLVIFFIFMNFRIQNEKIEIDKIMKIFSFIIDKEKSWGVKRLIRGENCVLEDDIGFFIEVIF